MPKHNLEDSQVSSYKRQNDNLNDVQVQTECLHSQASIILELVYDAIQIQQLANIINRNDASPYAATLAQFNNDFRVELNTRASIWKERIASVPFSTRRITKILCKQFRNSGHQMIQNWMHSFILWSQLSILRGCPLDIIKLVSNYLA